MNSEIFHQATESSLSKVTEQSARSEALVALGKRLVVELELGDSVDTLGRWMAHYVAELIQQVELVTSDERSTKQAELRDTILALWAHRFELPNGARPFGEFEPILRAMTSMDPENETPRYFSSSRAPDDDTEESEDTRKWIESAKGLDYTSKLLIDYCLVAAAQSALDKSKDWVKLAEKAGMNESFDVRMIRFISDHIDLMTEPNPDEYQRRILRDRYERLESFLSLATILADDLKARLDRSAPSGDNSK